MASFSLFPNMNAFHYFVLLSITQKSGSIHVFSGGGKSPPFLPVPANHDDLQDLYGL